MEYRIMEKDEFTTRLLAEQKQRKLKQTEKAKEVEKMETVKVIKKIAPAIDKDGAKQEKKEITKMLETTLKKDFRILVQSNGEIFIRGLNADFTIKMTQKKERIAEFEE